MNVIKTSRKHAHLSNDNKVITQEEEVAEHMIAYYFEIIITKFQIGF
jgi:hypothetical protein